MWTSSGTPRRQGPSAPWDLGFQCLSPRKWAQPSSVGLVSSLFQEKKGPTELVGPAFLLSQGRSLNPAPGSALPQLVCFLSIHPHIWTPTKENTLFQFLSSSCWGPEVPSTKSHLEFSSRDSSVCIDSNFPFVLFPPDFLSWKLPWRTPLSGLEISVGVSLCPQAGPGIPLGWSFYWLWDSWCGGCWGGGSSSTASCTVLVPCKTTSPS